MKAICESDERRIFEFLHRAGTAIIALGWDSPVLDNLMMHTLKPDNMARRVKSPALAKLADEFFGPFESTVKPEADRDTFESLYEAFCTMLGADEKAQVPVNFRTFAHLETSHWELQDTPLAPFMPFPIFGLYIIRENDRNRYGDFLENVFCYPEPAADAPRNQYGQDAIESYLDSGDGAELRTTGEGWERIDFTDPAEMDADPRYSARYSFNADALELEFTPALMDALANVGPYAVEDGLDIIGEQLADMASQDAREWFGGNACHPKAILDA